MQNRYVDKGYWLLYWAKSIEVICPKCGNVGLINGTPDFSDWHATFSCTHCAHTMKTGPNMWQGPVRGSGRQPCSACGHQWVSVEKTFTNKAAIKSKSATAVAQCPICHAENIIELKLYRDAPLDHALDPFFGLDLALKQATRHGIIWVYGADHLYELKGYIEAKIRVPSDAKWGYFNRLPTWIKTAKNREMVLKALAKLEKRLVKKKSSTSQ